MTNPEKKIMDSRSENVVTKSNKLIEASYKLTLTEQKTVLAVVSNVEPDDEDFKVYTFGIKKFQELLGLKGSAKYTEMRKITKDLLAKTLEIKLPRRTIQTTWFSSVVYNENEGTIDVRFDPNLKPFLLQLKKEFTSYKLGNVIEMRSSYSIRLYELLKQYENIKERTMAVADLRRMLNTENKYPLYANFKKKVVIVAQEEISNKTDINVSFEEIKKGRKVDKIKFIIKKKQKEVSEDFGSKLQDFQSDNTFEERLKAMARRVNVRINKKMLETIDRCNPEEVLNILIDMELRDDIDNPTGYFIYMLKKIIPIRTEMIPDWAAKKEDENIADENEFESSDVDEQRKRIEAIKERFRKYH